MSIELQALSFRILCWIVIVIIAGYYFLNNLAITISVWKYQISIYNRKDRCKAYLITFVLFFLGLPIEWFDSLLYWYKKRQRGL
jgi:hypothetical protein